MKITIAFFSILVLFSCTDAGGLNTARKELNNKELSHLIKNKKYSLIYFWTTWCGPCRKTISQTLPVIEKSIDTSRFQLLVIAVSKDEEKINKIINSSGLKSRGFRLSFMGPDMSLTHKMVLEDTLEELFPDKKVWRNSVPVFIMVDNKMEVIRYRMPTQLEDALKILQEDKQPLLPLELKFTVNK